MKALKNFVEAVVDHKSLIEETSLFIHNRDKKITTQEVNSFFDAITGHYYKEKDFYRVISFVNNIASSFPEFLTGSQLMNRYQASRDSGKVFESHVYLESLADYYLLIKNPGKIKKEVEEHSEIFPFELPILFKRLEIYIQLKNWNAFLERHKFLIKLVELQLQKIRGIKRDREAIYRKYVAVLHRYSEPGHIKNRSQLEIYLFILNNSWEKHYTDKKKKLVLKSVIELLIIAEESYQFNLIIHLIEKLNLQGHVGDLVLLLRKSKDYNYLELIKNYPLIKEVLGNKKQQLILENKNELTIEKSVKSSTPNISRREEVESIASEQINRIKKMNDSVMENLIKKDLIGIKEEMHEDFANSMREMELFKAEIAIREKLKNGQNK